MCLYLSMSRHSYQAICVEARGQFCGGLWSSPLCRCWGLNVGLQAWVASAFTGSSILWAPTFVFLLVYIMCISNGFPHDISFPSFPSTPYHSCWSSYSLYHSSYFHATTLMSNFKMVIQSQCSIEIYAHSQLSLHCSQKPRYGIGLYTHQPTNG